ncbi:Reverse transcriptase [Theobroma cacao]|nr:Reverse transcriptase [Theobroma cacao]
MQKIPYGKRTKLDPKSQSTIHLGYSNLSNGYRLYDLKTKKIFISCGVKFDEKLRWNWKTAIVENSKSNNAAGDENEDLKWNWEITVVENNDDGDENLFDNEESVDENDKSLAIRGTRPLQEIYSRCNMVVIEPNEVLKVLKDEKWKEAMDGEMQMIAMNKTCSNEATLYVKKFGNAVKLIVSLYVDDLLITGPNDEFLKEFKAQIKSEFDMTDLGKMSFFISLEFLQLKDQNFLHQSKYAEDLLKKFNMNFCKLAPMPLTMGWKLSKDDGEINIDA